MTADDVTERAAECCGHSLRWHHETRGCGYHGFGPSRCACVLTFEEALAEHDAAVAAKAWSEAVAAAAWAMDRGPDPLRYVAETNPYKREAGESGADA